jgi:hypothetical protein
MGRAFGPGVRATAGPFASLRDDRQKGRGKDKSKTQIPFGDDKPEGEGKSMSNSKGKGKTQIPFGDDKPKKG